MNQSRFQLTGKFVSPQLQRAFYVSMALSLLALTSVSATGNQPPHALADDLIAYWTLNETSGTRADVVGSNDLSESGAVGYAPGKVGNAAAFSGAERLSVTDNTVLTSSNGFTVTLWLYIQAISSEQTPAAASLGSLGGFPYEWVIVPMCLESCGLYFSINGSADPAELFSDPLTLNTWHFVVAWYDASTQVMAISVDGMTTEQPWLEGIEDLTDVPLFLNGADGGIGFTGRVDEVGFWNRALTPDERALLYNNGEGCNYPFDNCQQSGSSSLSLDLSFTQFQISVLSWFHSFWPIVAFILAFAVLEAIVIMVSVSLLNTRRRRR